MSSNLDQVSAATSVKGKAVITGASAGIGKVFAERLGKRGYDLILIARRLDKLNSLSAKLQEEYGVSVQTIPADLANSTQLRDVEDMIAADERVSLLLNNAGTATLGAFVDSTAEDISAMIDLNIVALTRLTHAVLPGFKRRDRGSIINIGSVLGLNSLPVSSIYSGTKGYVLNFTRGIQQEFAGTNVRVQLVLPGAIATDLWDISGIPLSQLDPATVITAENAVDATLAGFDRGESLTFPSLNDLKLFANYDSARASLFAATLTGQPANRYSLGTQEISQAS
jgi:short-subunit dehydrogenase